MSHDPSSDQEPASGTHEQFVQLFDDYLGALYPPSGGNRTNTGRRIFSQNLMTELDERSIERVLDCAAGTGFPTLDLQRVAPERFTIHCCDGDSQMIARLKDRAAEHDIDLGSMAPPRRNRSVVGSELDLVVNWSNLHQLGERYDLVLCRGNALAYTDTWAGAQNVASAETIRAHVERMIALLPPGGHLYVDAPETGPLDKTINRILGRNAKSIVEEVAVEEGRRRWEVTFRYEGERPLKFTRYSSLLTIDRLQAILKDIGLEETDPIELAGERDNFGVIIARKPLDWEDEADTDQDPRR